jgi:hypothetical protein
MTRTDAIARRLARLERAYVEWVRTLTDAELDELCSRIPPAERAAFDTLTDDELERLAAGRMPNAEWQRIQNRTRANGT